MDVVHFPSLSCHSSSISENTETSIHAGLTVLHESLPACKRSLCTLWPMASATKLFTAIEPRRKLAGHHLRLAKLDDYLASTREDLVYLSLAKCSAEVFRSLCNAKYSNAGTQYDRRPFYRKGERCAICRKYQLFGMITTSAPSSNYRDRLFRAKSLAAGCHAMEPLN